MHFKIAKSAQSYFNNIMNLEGSHAAEDKNKFPIRCVLLLCIDWHGSRPNRRGYFGVEGSC